MKTIEELESLRIEALKSVNLRGDNSGKIRIVVGMATCGIAAGAREVLMTATKEITEKNLSDVVVYQSGCNGHCNLEPIVEVYFPDNEKYTYVNINEEKMVKIIDEHIIGKNPCKDLMIG